MAYCEYGGPKNKNERIFSASWEKFHIPVKISKVSESLRVWEKANVCHRKNVSSHNTTNETVLCNIRSKKLMFSTNLTIFEYLQTIVFTQIVKKFLHTGGTLNSSSFRFSCFHFQSQWSKKYIAISFSKRDALLLTDRQRRLSPASRTLAVKTLRRDRVLIYIWCFWNLNNYYTHGMFKKSLADFG